MDPGNHGETLRSFCANESFFDSEQSWNAELPKFSNCFRKTVLVWFPCAVFWILAPFQIWSIQKSVSPPYGLSKLAIVKISSAIVLILLSVGDLVFEAFRKDSRPVDIFNPIIRFLTFVAIVGIIQAERRSGKRISPIQFLFWLTFLPAQSLNLYNDVVDYTHGSLNHVTPFVTLAISIAFICISLGCHFFAEPAGDYQDPGNGGIECPEVSASFPSSVIFAWFDRLCWTGYKRALTLDDLWSLNFSNSSGKIVPKFLGYYQDAVRKRTQDIKQSGDDLLEKNKSNPKETTPASTLGPLIKTFGLQFALGSLMKLTHDFLMFIAPMILKLIINFAASDAPIWHGVLYCFLLFLTSSVITVLMGHYFYFGYLISLRMKTALTSAIYRKALKISSAGKKDTTTGEVVNLMSVDVQKITEMIVYANMAWSAPFQILVALYFLWQTLGPSVLAGFFVMILLVPLNMGIAGKTRKLQAKQMIEKDSRVKMMNELLQGIKILKLYGWETSFQSLIGNIRQREIDILRQMGYFNTIATLAFSCAPYLVSLVTFATFVLSSPDNVLDSEKAFVALSLFNILNFPLSVAPMMIMMIVQASVALKRIDRFMNRSELKNDVEIVRDRDGFKDELVNDVQVFDASFKWSFDQETSTLSDITMNVRRGSLVAIVGTVGSGKSSLMSAILGEMEKEKGSVRIRGSLAYTSQQAWVQNCTLKENILFHRMAEEDFYQKVIQACALVPDIAMLPGGDGTEIGENGINLSGGQKQRVSIARSVYNKADIYLFDDPLSAVDSHVGKHIFDEVIGHDGMLKGKTRILVTHSITHLPKVDKIYVMKDGQISESGTYKELIEQKGAFAEVLVQFLSEEMIENKDEFSADLDLIQSDLMNSIGKAQFEEKLAKIKIKCENLDRKLSEGCSSLNDGSKINLNGSRTSLKSKGSGSPSKLEARTSVSTTKEASTIPKQGSDKQYESERLETGGVSLQVYLYYIKNMGLSLSVFSLFFFSVSQAFNAYSNIWLSRWSDSSNRTSNFFNETVNDESARDLYLGVYGGLGFGQTVTAFIGALMLYLAVLQGSKNLHNKVLSNVLRLPMSYFDTTPHGRIINRFGKDIDVLDSTMPFSLRLCITTFLAVTASFLVISYTTPVFLLPISIIMVIYCFIQRVFVASIRQLRRLESVTRSPIYSHFGETVNGAATIRAYNVQDTFVLHSESLLDENQRTLYPTICANRWLSVRLETIGNITVFSAALLAVLGRETLSPGLVGLSISYAMSTSQILNWLVRMISEVETNIVSVERLKEYADLPKEADWTIESTKPTSQWPHEGRIEFRNYSSRYREGLDLVLKSISFEIHGGEKIGVVGRTGAGKSSLMLGLFRIVEASEGSIYIDGIDISTLGLHELRNQLTIIPQDPVLFSGTLRMNLDPFNKHSDEELWKALQLSYLDDFVGSLSEGLEHKIAEGGENLSVGQRQLVCLTRALLRKTRILVLDEATAAVDLETDSLIQSTIKREFSDCTVLTIAHRLNTIIDYTKILVLSQGKRVEYDTPQALMADPNSIFYGMCKDAGLL